MEDRGGGFNGSLERLETLWLRYLCKKYLLAMACGGGPIAMPGDRGRGPQFGAGSPDEPTIDGVR